MGFDYSQSDALQERFEHGEGDLVPLDQDHPGFRDEAYRARRNEIAKIALEYRGGPVPTIDYTPEENNVWKTVWGKLAPLYEEHAHSQLVSLNQQLHIPHDRIPQLQELNEHLHPATGFRMEPVAGLIAGPIFLKQMGRSVFLSTQYVRHHTVPLYTPEPDVIHEVAGHAALLMHPDLADLNREFGAAAHRATDTHHAALERIYWYTVEFGAVREDGQVKGWGAGILSSFGELQRFSTEAELLDWDIDRMAATDYDPTQYQPHIFVAPSFDAIFSTLKVWLRANIP